MNTFNRETRRILLSSLVMAAALGATAYGSVETEAPAEQVGDAPVEPASPPNVIVVLADDMRADYTGYGGHPVVQTPNIDQLAADGTVFNSAFATSAVCTPSRTSLLSGEWERRHGVNFNSDSAMTNEAWSRTYPMLLKEAGYFVSYIGKNHTPLGKNEELYDLVYDPLEVHNVIEDPANAEILERLRAENVSLVKKLRGREPFDTYHQFIEVANAESAEEAWYQLVGENFAARPEFLFVENDPELPNVLIYGDSVSIEYTERVRDSLQGQANVYRLYCNGGDSASFIPKMNKMNKTMRDGALDGAWTFRWDVIHFNVGLHDLKYISNRQLDKVNGEQVTAIEEYRQNLRDIVAYLKHLDSGAKLIFATTTPVPECEPGRFAGDVQKYNQAALDVMREYPEIEINDLFTFTKPYQSDWWTIPCNVHFNDVGKYAQGDEVARILSATLTSRGNRQVVQE